jgi:hypothetical protein
MGYRIRDTSEYIMTEFGLREHFKGQGKVPNPLTTEWLESKGVDPVFEGPQATGGTVYQYSQFSGLEQIEGKWYTKYILGPVFIDGETTAAEQEVAYKAQKDAEFAKSARDSRDNLLSECDWIIVMSLEAGRTIPAEWATYRQELRDLPQQAGFPTTVNWPVKP